MYFLCEAAAPSIGTPSGVPVNRLKRSSEGEASGKGLGALSFLTANHRIMQRESKDV